MDQQSPTNWLPAFIGLLGAVIGAVASISGTLISEKCRNQRESTQLKASLIAEINAILYAIEVRGYLKTLDEISGHLKLEPKGTKLTAQVLIPEHYSRIYQANAANIGKLDSGSAYNIVQFHQLIDAVVQDVTPGGVLAEGAELEVFEEASRMVRKAITIGKEIVRKTA